MKGFVCKICGFISINGSAPEKCPVCGAPKKAFEEKEGAVKTAKDVNNLSELEKKTHTCYNGCKEMWLNTGRLPRCTCEDRGNTTSYGTKALYYGYRLLYRQRVYLKGKVNL